MTDGLRQVWDELSREHAPQTGWLTRRILPGACCPIRAAIAGNDHMPALLVEVNATSIRSVIDYPAGNGFSLVPEPITPGPHGAVQLCLALTNRTYHDQFCALVEDVLAAVVGAAAEDAAVTALLSRLSAWQNFMQRHSDGLTIEEQTGLFAELTFLGRVCYQLLALRALDAWKGPVGGVRDFVIRRSGIELKATTAAGSTTFHVSNLRQLDDTGLDHLFVCRYMLAQSEAGISLTELVGSTRQLFGDGGSASGDQFRHLLLAAGYSDVHAPMYQARRLEVRDVRYFRITDGFPRLTPATVPAGIAGASYVVELAGSLSYEMTETVVVDLISPGGQ